MAPGRRAVGGLTTVAVVLALAVAGCGGGDSSASGTASTGSTDGGASVDVEAQGQSPAGAGDGAAGQKSETGSGSQASEKSSGASGKKKHPPLQLPTGMPEKGATQEQIEAVPAADVAVTVPGGLTAANTCKGDDLSPSVRWKSVPPDTAELALFVMPLQPVPGSSSPLYFDWAVAGIDPSLGELKAGELPEGAIVGRNSAGENDWELCPEGSGPENYIFALYALSESLGPETGFDPLELRKEATDKSDNVGLFSVTY